MKKLTLVICLFVFSLNTTSAQGNQELIQSITENSWQGKGVLMGVSATFKMDWEFVLDKQFLKLNFSSTRLGTDRSKITFGAHAYYKIDESKIIGNWFDSRGIVLSLTGEINGNQLMILWGSVDTEQGKTIYTLVNENKISVKDYILQNEKYVKFGEANYTHVD